MLNKTSKKAFASNSKKNLSSRFYGNFCHLETFIKRFYIVIALVKMEKITLFFHLS